MTAALALALLLAAPAEPVDPLDAPPPPPKAVRPTLGGTVFWGGALLGGASSTAVISGAIHFDVELSDWIVGLTAQAAVPFNDGPFNAARYLGVRAGRFFGAGRVAPFATVGLGSFRQTLFTSGDFGTLAEASGAAVALEVGLMVHRTGGWGRAALVGSALLPLFTQRADGQQVRVPLVLGGLRLAF